MNEIESRERGNAASVKDGAGAPASERMRGKSIKKTIQTILILFFIALILAIVGFLFFLKWSLATPLNSNDKKVLFEVKEGESSFQVGQHLLSREIIRSDWIFYLNVRFKDMVLVPGVYDISSNMSVIEICDQISSGKTKIVKITIPEGYRREQIAQKLAENDLVTTKQFLDKTSALEGHLFPDTYYFSPDNTADEIVTEMTKNYEDRTTGLDVSLKTLTIASIVEREADNETERPIIAGIYENRLKIGMKMEADPTVQYAKDSLAFANLSTDEKKSYKFWRAITNADYKTAVSPYNTFLADALPAGPICNPGIASIKATINYTPSDYLYFIVANGQVYGAKTYAEHKANVAKYLN
jgi:UPF0755 protein